jgi:hypothetical protein
MTTATNSSYTYEFNELNGLMTKTEVETGNTWMYPARPKPEKPVFKAKNGVTVESIQQAGHSVRVKHLRWALYVPHVLTMGYKAIRTIVVPSTFRKDSNYVFDSHGGYTHVVIKKKDGKYLCVSSECAPSDPFCYAAGVAAALDRLTSDEIRSLEL